MKARPAPGPTPGVKGAAREALLESAAELFSERGPAAVSTREIASHAGVNSGLIHRHFGTKDELLRQSLDRLSHGIAGAGDAGVSDVSSLLGFLDAARRQSTYWRLLARCLLDGKAIEDLQDDFPTVRAIVERVADLQDQGAISADIDPRVVAAVVTGAGLGWLMFEPFLLRAAGLEGEYGTRIREQATELVARLLR